MSVPQSIGMEVVHRHLTAMDGVAPKSAWGETSYFYNPGQRFERGAYFATIKEKDGDNDRASGLDRPDFWRLNIGVSKKTFISMFGPPPPPRPAKGQIIVGPWEFREPDLITPHPVYGWMSWIAVLNPSRKTWARCQLLLEDAHSRAVATFEKRVGGL
jgi:hypothetical protein